MLIFLFQNVFDLGEPTIVEPIQNYPDSKSLSTVRTDLKSLSTVRTLRSNQKGRQSKKSLASKSSDEMKTPSNIKGKRNNDVMTSAVVSHEMRGEPGNRKRSSTLNEELNLIKKRRLNEDASEPLKVEDNFQTMLLKYELGKHKVKLNFF